MTPTDPTARLVHRPRLPRLIARACTALEHAGVMKVPLEESTLLELARRRTGLSDFGDPAFREPLGVLLRSLREQAELDVLGRYAMRKWCLDLLCNRLWIQDTLARHPEIHDVAIGKPLFVVGWPRTGTTLLQNLLAHQEGARTLLFWEQFAPAPPPGDRDPRIGAARQFVRTLRTLSPTIDVTHPIAATAPEECNGLFQNGFLSPLFPFLANIPAYTAYQSAQDMVPAYRYYRMQLQLLSRNSSHDHWVLKAPAHIYALDALLAVFPDASIVMTHRNPREVLPSVCSLTMAYRRVFARHVDPFVVGRYWMEELQRVSRLIQTARAAADPRRFLDVDYSELLRDPRGTVRRIHDHFGYAVAPSCDERIGGWLAQNPQHKHGVHRYDLATFGLDARTIDQRFAEFPASAETARAAWGSRAA